MKFAIALIILTIVGVATARSVCNQGTSNGQVNIATRSVENDRAVERFARLVNGPNGGVNNSGRSARSLNFAGGVGNSGTITGGSNSGQIGRFARSVNIAGGGVSNSALISGVSNSGQIGNLVRTLNLSGGFNRGLNLGGNNSGQIGRA